MRLPGRPKGACRSAQHEGSPVSTPTRRQALRRMGAAALLLGARDIAFGASIVAVRVWPAPDYSRVTIEPRH